MLAFFWRELFIVTVTWVSSQASHRTRGEGLAPFLSFNNRLKQKRLIA